VREERREKREERKEKREKVDGLNPLGFDLSFLFSLFSFL